jgi:hypothetical protein
MSNIIEVFSIYIMLRKVFRHLLMVESVSNSYHFEMFSKSMSSSVPKKDTDDLKRVRKCMFTLLMMFKMNLKSSHLDTFPKLYQMYL